MPLSSSGRYIHILVYVFITPPPTTFLNAFFSLLDDAFPLFGVIAYGLFSFCALAALGRMRGYRVAKEVTASMSMSMVVGVLGVGVGGG